MLIFLVTDADKYVRNPKKWKETFEKCTFLFEVKEDDNFNHRNTLSISRIKIWVWRRNRAKRGVLQWSRKETHDIRYHNQEFLCISSDQRCRGGCRRAACGPDGERIAEILKKSFRAAGIQTAALFILGLQTLSSPFFVYYDDNPVR